MPHTSAQQRMLACHFPHLSTDRIARQRWGNSWQTNGQADRRRDRLPLVVISSLKNAIRVSAIEADTRLDGIRIGQTLSDARAINPQIDCVQHDADADKTLLEKIARWCERYTPLIATDEANGLALDITGCAHLFGGEDKLLEDMQKRLHAQGFAVRLAIADTLGAAWALARYSGLQIADPGQHSRMIEPLPLDALRLKHDKVVELARLGFKTVGCLCHLPRAPVAARFGDVVLRRLDQALGREDEVLSYLRPVAELVCEKRFAEPIVYEDDVRGTIKHLASRLVPDLEKRALGMRQCELNAFRADGEVISLVVEASSPLRNAAQIARLFNERLSAMHDEWDAGFGFDIMRLSVLRSDRLDAQQTDILDGKADGVTQAELVDRLSARLGADRVAAYHYSDTHIPERRFALASALHVRPNPVENSHPLPEVAARPLVLLDRPERIDVMASVPEGPPLHLRWRKTHYEIIRSEGPERIACEWWKDGRNAYSRDYFRVETREGYRLWLFRHGLYERETSEPQWYVQGLFA